MTWAPDYVTVDELAAYKVIPDTVDDEQLAVAIAAASRAVDDHCNRQFGKVAAAEERIYTAGPDYLRGYWVVTIDDLMTTNNLAVELVDGAEAVATFTLEPRNAAARGRPWTRLVFTADSEALPSRFPHEVSVIGEFGWLAVLQRVKEATLLQASRFDWRRNAPAGVAGSPDLGSELRLLSKLDPDVAVALRGLVRPRALG